MPLKVIVDDIDTVDEAHRPLYSQEAEGKPWVLDLEGIDQHPHVTGLRTAFEKEKNERKKRGTELADAKAKLEAYGDITAEDAKALADRRQEIEDAKLVADDKVEQLIEEKTKRMRTDHDAVVKAKDAEITKLTTERDDLSSKFRNTVITSAINAKAHDLGALPGAVEIVSNLGGKLFQLDDDGKPVAMKDGDVEYGKDGAPLSIDEWVESLKTEKPFLFDRAAGSGADNAGGRDGGNRTTFSLAANPNAIGDNLEKVAKGEVRVDLTGGAGA